MRSLESPSRTGRGAEPRTVRRLGALSVQLVDSDEQVRNRDAYFRRLLATADVLAAGIALIVATSFGGDGDRLALAAVLALPVFVVLAKLLGLYERDELVINKSTLDEAPAVFQLATLFVLLVWLAEAYLINGSFGKPQFVVLGLTTFVGVLVGARLHALARHPHRSHGALPPARARLRGRSHRGQARARPARRG